jgi:hypothetical protein
MFVIEEKKRNWRGRRHDLCALRAYTATISAPCSSPTKTKSPKKKKSTNKKNLQPKKNLWPKKRMPGNFVMPRSPKSL